MSQPDTNEMTDLIERLPPIICSQGGVPYNKAHLDARDVRIAGLSAALKAKNKEIACLLSLINDSDTPLTVALRREREAIARATTAESLLASVKQICEVVGAVELWRDTYSDGPDAISARALASAKLTPDLVRQARALASSPPREGDGSIKPETIASAFPSSLTTGEQRPEDALLAALLNVQKIISEAALTGFNCKDGDWADRLFFSQQKTSAAIARATNSAPGSPVANSPSNEGEKDRRQWLNDLIRAAEAFRMAMVGSGALDRTPQDKYFAQLRALERALNPLNYTFPPDPKQQAGGPEGWQLVDALKKVDDWFANCLPRSRVNGSEVGIRYGAETLAVIAAIKGALFAVSRRGEPSPASPPPPGSAAGSGVELIHYIINGELTERGKEMYDRLKATAATTTSPAFAEMVEALKCAKEKLTVYYHQTNGRYGGGPQYDQLIKQIDAALSRSPQSAPAERACYWHTKCSDHKRCDAFGSCVALAQRRAIADGDFPSAPVRKEVGENVRAFATAILHGDDEHKAWLLEAADDYCAGRPIAPVRSNPNA
jgi:hypothetical protein